MAAAAAGAAAARRLTCLFILLLIATWISFAKASQAGFPDSNHKISTGKVNIKAVIAATGKNIEVGGRKMVVKRQGKQSTVSHILSDEVDDSGFVAFNADYHAPRHHPPKNN